MKTPGIHHVTAIGSDPSRNREFYTETLGLRLVKQSVNQDDVGVYHLFYGDERGSPGTSMTFFPYVDANSGQVGTGQVSTVAFLVPESALDYWVDRLDEAGVEAAEREERFGDTVIAFEDPDGLPLELVAVDDDPEGHPPKGPVPAEHAIRGFQSVTLSLASAEETAGLLKTMGFEATQSDHDRQRFESDGDLGYAVDLLEDPHAQRGRPGAGTVHHVAFRVDEDEQEDWRDVLIEAGLRPTEIIDRKWFKSVYAREHAGVLFEFATESPGYTVDEELSALGERLVLPEWLEDQREEIEANLPELHAE
ncbi:MAG: VOC family protein [Halopenitus sp.]